MRFRLVVIRIMSYTISYSSNRPPVDEAAKKKGMGGFETLSTKPERRVDFLIVRPRLCAKRPRQEAFDRQSRASHWRRWLLTRIQRSTGACHAALR
jgi:hypothetical protein